MTPARAAFALLALVLPLVVACDPTYSVSGTVVDASGAALVGATVTMACPSGRTEVVTTTAGGEFAFGGVGGSFEAPKCSLRIEKPGFIARTVAEPWTPATAARSPATPGSPARRARGSSC